MWFLPPTVFATSQLFDDLTRLRQVFKIKYFYFLDIAGEMNYRLIACFFVPPSKYKFLFQLSSFPTFLMVRREIVKENTEYFRLIVHLHMLIKSFLEQK